MTRANQWLVFSSALSVVAGFFSGIRFSRRSVAGPAEHASAIGRLYEIEGETYVDGGVYDFLRARADAREQLGMHLVPRASDLAHQESFEWRKVFVEPFAIAVSHAHADLRRPFVGRHELTKTHFSTTATFMPSCAARMAAT